MQKYEKLEKIGEGEWFVTFVSVLNDCRFVFIAKRRVMFYPFYFVNQLFVVMLVK